MAIAKSIRDKIISKVSQYWLTHVRDRAFTELIVGKEPGHRMADYVDDKTAAVLKVNFDTRYEGDRTGAIKKRSMGDIWVRSSSIYNPINIKSGLMGMNGQPNLVSMQKLLNYLFNHWIDAYYLLIVKFESAQNKVIPHVYLVDLLEWLDFVTYDAGPGQIMLREQEFYNRFGSIRIPQGNSMHDKVSMLFKLSEEQVKSLIANREKRRRRKHQREYKRQMGQYMTPPTLAMEVSRDVVLLDCARILEPSCGNGVFLSALADRISARASIPDAKAPEIIGVEIDPKLAGEARRVIAQKSLEHPGRFKASVLQADFFEAYLTGKLLAADGSFAQFRRESFDLIIGNPPFGGTFNQMNEDLLDKLLGKRFGKKIKKETYAFFIVACVDLLRAGGHLVFICSDTLLTIKTMAGLRQLLMEEGEVCVRDIQHFSDETTYPMLILDFKKGGHTGRVIHNSHIIPEAAIRATPNLSWGNVNEFAHLFAGPLLTDYCVASSGMTTGNNPLFIREIDSQNRILEPYKFELYDAPITVEYEKARARLGKVPAKRRIRLEQSQAAGETEKRLRATRLVEPLIVQLPDDRYRPYNKASNRLIFSAPIHYIFWENEGEAVLTYKKTGNWYLRGIGGLPYFGRDGITWPLVASRFVARYLPEGYILDSGAPCAFLREGINRDEIFYILGWLLSPLANRILKTVINHTRNIQSKDFERMPYPWWVSSDIKQHVIDQIKQMISDAERGRIWSRDDQELRSIGDLFEYTGTANLPNYAARSATHQKPLFTLPA